jgi:hypothetical protein
MSNDIRDIIERLAILEGRITPVDVKHGLNADQKSVKQLPALFKPKDISPTLSKTPYQNHPMDGWLVGEEDEEADKEVVESAMSNIDYLMQEIGAGDVDIYDIYANPKTEEEKYASKIVNRMYDDVVIDRGLHPDDNFEEILEIVADQIAQDYPMDNTINEAKVDEEKLLDKVKKSLTDYLQSVEEKLEKKVDRDLGNKPQDHDLGKKEKKDRDLVAKDSDKSKELDEDPTQEDPVIQTPTLPQQDPTYAESYAVKTIEMAPGKICEIHGNEKLGFEIRHGNRKLPSRFRNLDEAVMAVEMFRSRQHTQDESQDYIEEK